MNINTVTISGRLGKEAEIRYAPSGMAIANFSVAVQGYDKNKAADEQPTNWIDVKAFGKTAEFIADRADRGARVCIMGELNQEKWKDKQSNANRSKIVLIARSVDLFDWKDAPQNRPASQPPASKEPAPADDGFDDIPF